MVWVESKGVKHSKIVEDIEDDSRDIADGEIKRVSRGFGDEGYLERW